MPNILPGDPRIPGSGDGSNFQPILPGTVRPPFNQKKGSNTLFTDPPMGPNMGPDGMARNRVRLSKRERLARAKATHGVYDSPEVIKARATLDAYNALSKQDEQRILLEAEAEKRQQHIGDVRHSMNSQLEFERKRAESRQISAVQRAITHAGGDPSAMEAYGFQPPAQTARPGLAPAARPGQEAHYPVQPDPRFMPPSGTRDDSQNPAYGGEVQAPVPISQVGPAIPDESQATPEQLAQHIQAEVDREQLATARGQNPAYAHQQAQQAPQVHTGTPMPAQGDMSFEQALEVMKGLGAEVTLPGAPDVPVDPFGHTPEEVKAEADASYALDEQLNLNAALREEIAALHEAQAVAQKLNDGLAVQDALAAPEIDEVAIEAAEGLEVDNVDDTGAEEPYDDSEHEEIIDLEEPLD